MPFLGLLMPNTLACPFSNVAHLTSASCASTWRVSCKIHVFPLGNIHTTSDWDLANKLPKNIAQFNFYWMAKFQRITNVQISPKNTNCVKRYETSVFNVMTFEEFKLKGFIYSQHSLIHSVSVENYHHIAKLSSISKVSKIKMKFIYKT